MAFTFRQVRRSLKKKGFVEKKDKHHIYLHHQHEGKRTGPYTFVSHGGGKDDVGFDIVKKMQQQLNLPTNRDVQDLVDCPMSASDYEEILADKGIIDTGAK